MYDDLNLIPHSDECILPHLVAAKISRHLLNLLLGIYDAVFYCVTTLACGPDVAADVRAFARNIVCDILIGCASGVIGSLAFINGIKHYYVDESVSPWFSPFATLSHHRNDCIRIVSGVTHFGFFTNRGGHKSTSMFRKPQL